MACSARLLVLPLLPLLATFATSSSHYHNSTCKRKLTVAVLLPRDPRRHFYFHEILVGPNATAMAVAVPPGAELSFATFGAIGVIDDMLREGPDPDSRLLGRAQGLVSQASQEGMGLFTAFNLVFTAGEFKGSTLAVMGRLSFSDPQPIERSIVGGSGKFRMARGYTLTTLLTPAPSPSQIPDSFVEEIDAFVYNDN